MLFLLLCQSILDPLNSTNDLCCVSQAMGHPAVMVHGDMWSNNILFRPDAKLGTGSEVLAVIDWQGSHAGNPVEDLLRVLVSSTPTDIRRRYWKTILRSV